MCFCYSRRCIVTKVENKLTQAVGKQEFDIPKNVLDLIYLQTLLWSVFIMPCVLLASFSIRCGSYSHVHVVV